MKFFWLIDVNWGYVVAAYTATWVAILGYTIGVSRALRRARAAYARATVDSRAGTE